MKIRLTYRKKVAAALLSIWLLNITLPPVCLALTSGPAQPEAQSFQPAGVSDMVDLFSGDFKYNIPLLDVDGYPINLNYESGSGMDDEASWVGLGWNVNVGAINRQVRGLPDDVAGDSVETDHYTKPKVTVGGNLSVKLEVKGLGTNLLSANGSLGLGIFNDNYTGVGAEITANAGISFASSNESGFTAGMGLGITSNTASGVEVSPYMNLGIKEKSDDNVTTSAGLSASLGYNTRSGLKNLTLGSSFDVTKTENQLRFRIEPNDVLVDQGTASNGTGGGASGSAISFNTEPISPNLQVPYRSSYGSFSIDVGPVAEIVYLGGGLTGYKSVREVVSQQIYNPAYGFLYAERGKNQPNATMDFTREKENPIIPELPNLAVPVPTPDLFSYTSQTGSGQFRIYRGGSGAFFDAAVSDNDGVTSVGGDIGYGFIAHGGVTLFKQNTQNNTRKWTANNNYLGKADFQDASYTDPSKQHAYFKVVGEKTVEDSAMVAKLHDIQPLAVSITGKTANASFTNASLTNLVKSQRQVNQTAISYLTASEASNSGLDKKINVYPLYDISTFTVPANNKPVKTDSISRVSSYRKPHHLSEITVTDGSGKRQVYGLPVYNIGQSEYSFAIGSSYSKVKQTNNLVQLSVNNPGTPQASINHNKGIDYYYHRQTQPAYASSFLLTAVLSPDYVDKTGNGITDDDLGTAIKFNYAKLSNPFKWRAPYMGGTLNKGLLADKDDDKASIVYGDKEIWYLSSIESKTKVAYFITEDRRDALGVTDFTGLSRDTVNKQRCLKEIRLYSKADMTKPIKVVKFEYSYELCRHLPNNADNHVSGDSLQYSSNPALGGKLTLKKVYFEYQNSPKGAHFPYQFSYINSIRNAGTGLDTAVNYSDLSTDRWGVYKSVVENKLPLKNDEFPYTNQDIQGADTTVKSRVNQNASLWHLNKITLPTGGVINVSYESDDYAYVQDQRATVMSGISSLIDGSGMPVDSNHLQNARGLQIKIPNTAVTGDPTAWFKQNYLNGSDYIYSKFYVKVSTNYSPSGGFDYDFIASYSPVDHVTISGGYANVFLQNRADHGVTNNPIIFSAWQTMRNEYPRYAYPGFDQRTGDGETSSAVGSAVKAVMASISNLNELTENFNHKALRKGFASNIQLSKSFVRVVKQDGHKLGGGVRVKKIQISDSWQAMAGNNSPTGASYGQAYTYTTVDNGQTISSGVASYEPTVGCDENPLRQPVPYVENIKGALDNFFDLEKPFGESFFPAPMVGYSKVTVTDLNKNGVPDPGLRTGYTADEFYTAKDFPVQAVTIPLQQNENKPVNKFSFVGANSIDELTMTQGYSIVLNDMHGKPKATRTFNQTGAAIASTEYYYKTAPKGADEFTLNNTVNVVNPDGTISQKVMGRDIDFFTDFREYETKNSGISDNIGFDIIDLLFFAFPLPHFPQPVNNEYKLFRSACAVKVSQYYGIVDHVVKTENGSSITTQNIAFDGLSGQPVVTSTQNEFNQTIYSTNIPAYWVYKGMGGAYQNAGILLQNFTTDATATIPSQYAAYLKAGDEIDDISGVNKRYWIIEDKADSATTVTKKLIDQTGAYMPNFSVTASSKMVKLVRSGYRNMLGSMTESIVCLNNPIQNNKLQFTSNTDLTSLHVINASATVFNDKWSMDQHGQLPDSTKYITGVANKYETAVSDSRRAQSGVYDFTNNTVYSNFYLQGGPDRSTIWPPPVTDPRNGQPVDIEKDVYLPAGTYYIGYCGDNNNYNYSIDGVALGSRLTSLWCLSAAMTFTTSGTHHFSLEQTNGSGYPGGIALEIYTSRTPGSYVFSSSEWAYQHDDFTYAWRKHINPYIRGFKGNWRDHGSLVFQQSRHYNATTSVKGVNVKQAGYVNNFSPYWYYSSSSWKTDTAGNRSRWVQANTVTGYDDFGQQIENKDALGRFSAAKFDFNGELPSAVASNAQNREIYAASFEDSFFSPGTVSGSKPDVDFVKTGTNFTIKSFAIDTLAHSGNYSVPMPSVGFTLTTNIHSKTLRTDSLLSVNTKGEYNIKPDTGLYPVGFEPMPGKKYIFDVWVKDDSVTNKSVNISLTMNGTSVPLICKALVENWKLVEGTLNIGALGSAKTLTLVLTPLKTGVFIDDLRIHPFNSEMKTYAYDAGTMRLMAEIDENGFATFYEYDDEGLLVRVKKETERGIMTIKESRSSYMKGL